MPGFRYQALEPLPSPGVSRAFLGLAILDEARAEPVVLIWVPDELARDIEKSERIQRDTERASLLEHPHIIRVYGFGRLEDGKLARVVEFADGENLRRVLDKAGPLPAELAARLIADAAQGVHYAHLAGNDDGTPLLHGDLRPETLLVSYKGLCKVSGYGAAAFAPKDSTARNLRVAPEQVLGGRAAMNVQTDVYLLGAALYECLTGKAPFEGEADFEQAVLTRELDLSGTALVPDALKPVIARALAKRAADRFPSALLLREAIELSLQPLPSHDEIGRWISEHFPDVDGTRAERQRILDKGIAAFARAQWSRATPQTTPSPFPAIAPPPPAATPPASAPAQTPTSGAPTPALQAAMPPAGASAGAVAPAPGAAAGPAPTSPAPSTAARSSTAAAAPGAPAQTVPSAAASAATGTGTTSRVAQRASSDDVDDRDRAKRFPVFPAIAVVLLVAAVGAWWALRSRNEGSRENTSAPPGAVAAAVTDAGAALESDAGATTAMAPQGGLPAGSADAGETALAAADAGTLAADAGVGATTAAADAPSGAAATAALGTLALKVEPSVMVEVDGVSVGRTPIKAAVAPGRRKVRLLDKAKGVDVTRFINVSEKGVTTEEIFLQKGFVAVTAPPGAVIEIDGKNVGKAPIRGEISVYEGNHSITVTMGKAKWRDSFTVRGNQRVYFDVGPQYE